MRKLLPAIVVTLVAIAAFWFFSHRNDRDGLLVFAPEDTPWIWANTQPLPASAVEGMWRPVDAMGPLYASSFAQMREDLADADPTLRALFAVVDEAFGDGDIRGASQRLGLHPAPHLVVYGMGLHPVMRLVVAEPRRFRPWFDDLIAAAGPAAEAVDVRGRRAHRIVLGDVPVALVLALLDDQLVAAIAPLDGLEDALPRLLGLERPGRPMAGTRILRDLDRRHGLMPHYHGYVDHRRVIELLLEGTALLDTLGLDGVGDLLHAEHCAAEARSLADAWPRSVVGYPRLDARTQDAKLVFEARQDIGASLARLRAPLAGFDGRLPDSLFDLGLAIQLDNLPRVVNQHADAVAAAPWKCAWLTPLNDVFASMRAQSASPFVFMAAPVLHSVLLSVADTGDLPLHPGAAEGLLAFGSQDPARLAALLQAGLPQLARLQLQPDRTQHALDASGLGLGLDAPLQVAMSDSVLAFATGDVSTGDLQQAFGAEPTRQPLLHVGLSGRVYALLAQLMQDQGGLWAQLDEETLAGLDPAAREELEAARAQLQDTALGLEAIAEVFERIVIEVELGEQGIELRQRTSLN